MFHLSLYRLAGVCPPGLRDRRTFFCLRERAASYDAALCFDTNTHFCFGLLYTLLDDFLSEPHSDDCDCCGCERPDKSKKVVVCLVLLYCGGDVWVALFQYVELGLCDAL